MDPLNSKELLEHLKSPTFNHATNIKSFDFYKLYTTVPHQKLSNRITGIIRYAFILNNGNRRYTYLVLGHEETYFVKKHSDSTNKSSKNDIIKILEFLIKVCRQSRKTFLLLCCLFFLVYFFVFSFISFPLSAFCDFSAICHRISLIFGQLVDNNL